MNPTAAAPPRPHFSVYSAAEQGEGWAKRLGWGLMASAALHGGALAAALLVFSPSEPPSLGETAVYELISLAAPGETAAEAAVLEAVDAETPVVETPILETPVTETSAEPIEAAIAEAPPPAPVPLPLPLPAPAAEKPPPPKPAAAKPEAVKPRATKAASPRPAGGSAEGAHAAVSSSGAARAADGVVLTAHPVRQPPPTYPAAARRRGLEGRVLLRVRVNADGDVDGVEIASSSGFAALDDAAAAAVRRWTFRPAQRLGLAVAAVVDVPVRFRLDDP